MGLQLPGELSSLLGMLGFTWPEADETKLFEMANVWVGFASEPASAAAAADGVARRILANNKGADFDAFERMWSADDAVVANLTTVGRSCLAVGAGMMIAALVVLVLKIQVIVQLIILAVQIAQAIATAVATFGASLLEIPIFRMITKLIIDLIIDQAVGALLG